MIEYPKIETLFRRSEEGQRNVTKEIRCPEFLIPRTWMVTEKIDGTNIRLCLDGENGTLDIRGRTDAAQLPPHLLNMLREKYTYEKVAAAFEPGVTAIIFGEGYGAKIQKGGGDYNPNPAFRIFDVAVLAGKVWWLEWDAIKSVACKIDTETVPLLATIADIDFTVDEVRIGINSVVAAIEGTARFAEGIVARTTPLLLFRNGDRLMWKLKTKDFGPMPGHRP